MVKFKNLWLFERSEFQMFLNFIIAQYMAEIKTKPYKIQDSRQEEEIEWQSQLQTKKI